MALILTNGLWFAAFFFGGMDVTMNSGQMLLQATSKAGSDVEVNKQEGVLQANQLLQASNSNPQEDVSKNEQQYDKKYWEWQASMNKFGAAFKGDVIRYLIGGMPTNPTAILEFGCSGGHILAGMPIEQKYGVEINPAARAYAKETFPDIKEVFVRPDDMPPDLMFDVIYTTSVLEHVDCPLCELRKLKVRLKPHGILIVGLKNDGAALDQTFSRYKNEPNHHIYTWNPLLLANMLDSAGYTPCSSIGQFDAWHAPIEVSNYQKDKHAYCTKGLVVGKKQNVYNMWSVSVHDGQCHNYKDRVNQLLNCQYLKQD